MVAEELVRVLWPFPPNWRDGVTVSYEFRTNIFTADDGGEQRRGLRSTPRKTLTFTALAHQSGLRRFNRLIDTAQNLMVVMPEVTRVAHAALPVEAGALTVTLTASPPTWIAPGAEVVLRDSLNGYRLAVVATVSGSTVSFTQSPGSLNAGACLYPALTGTLAEKVEARRVTSSTAEVRVTFAVDPGSEPETVSPEGTVFADREWLQLDHNWRSGLPVEHSWPLGTIDFGRGRVARYRSVDFPTSVRSFDLTSRAPQPLIDFFHRMKGRRGTFLCSSAEQDMEPAGDVAGSSLLITGTDLFYGYRDDPVRRYIEIRRAGAPPIAREITGMTLSGGDTAIALSEALPSIPASEIIRISWLTFARFASDTLEVQYASAEAAQVRLNVCTLPVSAADENVVLRATVDAAIRVTPQGDEREVIYL